MKSFYKSKTLWGIVGTVIIAVAPPLGKAITDKKINFETVGQLTALAVTAAFAGYSRWNADQPLSINPGKKDV